MRKYLVIGLVALCAIAMAVPAFALEVKFSGNMRVRANVQAELDGKNEWTDTSVRNAAISGMYVPGHIYDRGSHFLRTGNAGAGEDNPAAAGYATFLTPGGGAAAAADTAIGPALPALPSNTGIERGAQDNVDDEDVFLDQRVRIWITFQIADCVRQITAFEMGDALWGDAGQYADWGADFRDVEVKQAYLDFSIPAIPFPTNFKVGVLPFKLHRGWVVDVDAAGIIATATFEPIVVGILYIRAFEGGATEDRQDDADFMGVFVVFSMDQFSAQATLAYQDGPSSTFTSAVPTNFGAVEEFGNTIHWYALDADYTTESFKLYLTAVANGGSNDYYRLNDRTPNGVGVATANQQLTPVEADYNGWMANLGVDVYLGPFTLMLEGFYITGDEFKDFSQESRTIANQNFFLMEDADDAIDRYVYPGPGPWNANGATHYWSEILGAGTFDQASTGVGAVGSGSFGQWQGGLQPYNLWAIKLGGKYKLTDTTTLSAFYWYVNTVEDVVSSIREDSQGTFGAPINNTRYGDVIATDSGIGHEIDLYIDQALCDGLVLRLVGAYLFADDAYSIWSDDEDAYEYGARLQVSF
jgi:hypothetical protein